MKIKTKTSKRSQHGYSAFYLAIALGAVVLLEGFLLGVATPEALGNGFKILDMSAEIKLVSSDLFYLVEPLFEQYDNVNMFYQMSATELMYMLDLSEHDTFVFFRGVSEFYSLASIEMERVLDLSDQFVYWPQVASASISK